MISTGNRQRLLELARTALVARVRRGPAPLSPRDLAVPSSGLFVTIRWKGELRGCLGTLDGRERLADSVVRLSGDVAHADYRFQPLAAHELDDVSMALSVLTPTEVVGDPATIEIGLDGLIVQQGRRQGLLLPQVATEHGWDRETFLAHTCIKAGLPPDAWQRGAVILRFQAEVFGEIDRRRAGLS
jgi:AmmeMemoRadiSam system protein A